MPNGVDALTPLNDAVTRTWYWPFRLFEVNPFAEARPSAPVSAVKLFTPPGNEAPGPLLGNRNTTAAPATGLSTAAHMSGNSWRMRAWWSQPLCVTCTKRTPASSSRRASRHRRPKASECFSPMP